MTPMTPEVPEIVPERRLRGSFRRHAALAQAYRLLGILERPRRAERELRDLVAPGASLSSPDGIVEGSEVIRLLAGGDSEGPLGARARRIEALNEMRPALSVELRGLAAVPRAV